MFIYAVKKTMPAGLNVPAGKYFKQRTSQIGPAGPCILFSMGESKELFYKPTLQTWTLSQKYKCWIGFYKDNPPGPDELKKEKQLEGFDVELGDGNLWKVPIIRVISGGTCLPKSLILGSKGEVITKELPQYAELSARLNVLWEDYLIEAKAKEGEIKLDLKARFYLAAECLGWNYFIDIETIGALALFTTQNIGEVLAAILDLPTLAELINTDGKKKQKNEPD